MTRNTIAWIVQALLAVAFIFSGGNKLLHLEATTGMFGQLGLPSWLAYVIAGGELLGGIGLLIPRTTRLAAVGLMVIMLGAAFMHATRIPGGLLPKGIPAVVLLVLLALVLVLRQPADPAAK